MPHQPNAATSYQPSLLATYVAVVAKKACIKIMAKGSRLVMSDVPISHVMLVTGWYNLFNDMWVGDSQALFVASQGSRCNADRLDLSPLDQCSLRFTSKGRGR